MSRWALVVLCSGFSLAACGGGAGGTPDGGTADAAPDGGGATGAMYLYVANYTEGDISAFAVDGATGGLTEVAGSPFAAPSLGFALAYADPGRIFMPTGVADPNANGIHSFIIDWADGSLSAAAGSPLDIARADGSYGVSASSDGSRLFVNQPDVGGTVAVYEVDQAGALAELGSSPFSADGDLAANALNPTGDLLYVAAAQRNRVFGYQVTGLGLAPVPQGSIATGPSGSDYGENPQDLRVHPTSNFLYVGNFGSGNVAGYSIDDSGDLTELAGSPFATAQGTCGLAFDRQGQRLFATVGGTDSGAGQVYAFDLSLQTGELSAIDGSPFTVAAGKGCGIVAHPTADILYVVESGATGNDGRVHVLAIDPLTGALSAETTLTTPAGAGAAKAIIAVQPQ